MNLRYWRKAYMIEFLKNENEVEDVFTFSVPPESESLKFPQRITETPTMGGVVFDDYGNDTVKITLAGTTVNEEKKLIYQGNKKLPDYLTGEKEIFRLQELLEKWGSVEYEHFTSKKIYIYDLSKMNLLQIGAGSPARNYWRVINKGLDVSRAKDRPYTFVYKLELTGVVDKPQTPAPLFSEGFGKFLDGCQKVVAVIEKVAEVTEVVADTLDTFTQQIVDVKKFVEKLQKGDALHDVEAIMRKLPKGNSLWNATKAAMGTASKLRYLTSTPTSQTSGGTKYSRGDSFVVGFNSGAGSYVSPIRAAYGDYAEKPADPVLKNFKFLGWYTGPAQGELFVFEATEITRRITLYARWERVQATVTYNSRQGSAVLPATVDIGTAAAPPPPPTRQGYEFEYWCTDSSATVEYHFLTPITNDIILYAKWRMVFTVTFNSNGGSAIPPQGANTGDKVIYPMIPEKENHLFGMWCTDPNLNTEYNFDTPITGSITLYAKWTRVTNNVAFISNGGSPVPQQMVGIGGHAVMPPNPAREGYSFDRWYSDPELTQGFNFTSTQINYPTILYAKWTVLTLTVDFNSEGGSHVENQLIEYGKLAVYPITPTKEGCLFAHWCIIEMVENTVEVENEETGEMEESVNLVEARKKYDFSVPVVENLTLYAKWHEGTGA